MSDNPNKKGNRDDVEVSMQEHERAYLIRIYARLTAHALSEAIKAVGNNRVDVERYLKEHGYKKK